MNKLIVSILLISNIFLNWDLTFNELGSFFINNEQWLNDKYENIEFVYTKDNEIIKENIKEYLTNVPSEIKNGTKKIILYSYKNENIAGIAKDETIELYNLSQYSESMQKYIVYHELAHLWGNKLRQYKIVDYDYTKYKEVVSKDKNYITNYSKEYIINKNQYAEDFADGMAEYLINKEKFKKEHNNRFDYYEELLNLDRNFNMGVVKIELN